MCEGVHCFPRRGVCLVGSMGIVSFVVLLFLLVCFCRVVGDGLPCVEFCFSIEIVSSWWSGK